ncbi:MAG: SGNH/GDSL hydrolase family protein [Elusimicrobia bacterium]|nr:SGNH/GDSL hydrolase family protein [Elusimicrobiota bacterium]
MTRVFMRDLSQSRRRPAKLMAAACLIALETLLVLEALLRALPARLRPSGRTSSEWSAPYGVPHPAWGSWHRPDACATETADCFQARYCANSFGMRDKPRRLAGAVPRVAFLGDSYLEGLGVDDGETMTRLLEDVWWQGRIEALNLGVRNIGTTQEWLIYRELARKFRPDLVVLLFDNTTDPLDNSWWFRRDHRPLAGTRPYLLKDAAGRFELVHRENSQAQLARQAGRERRMSWLLPLVRRSMVLRALTAVHSRGNSARMLVRGLGPFGAYATRPDRDWELSWETTEEALARLKEDVERDGSKLLVIQLPDHFQVDPQAAAEIAARPGYDILHPNRRLREMTRRLGISYLSLYEPFMRHRDRQRPAQPGFNLPCDPHWAPLGHRVAAEALADVLPRMLGKRLVR